MSAPQQDGLIQRAFNHRSHTLAPIGNHENTSSTNEPKHSTHSISCATRAIALIMVLAGIGLSLVWIRSAQTVAAASLLDMESQRIALRRELWDIETRTARLRAPARIRQAAERSPADLTPPGVDKPLRGPATVIVQRP